MKTPYRLRPLPQKRRRPRRVQWAWWTVVAVFVLVLAGGAVNVLRPVPAPVLHTISLSVPTQPVVLQWPASGAAAVQVQQLSPLLEHGTPGALPTASVAKLITSLVVLQKQPLAVGQTGPTLTLTQSDLDAYHVYAAKDGSVVPVQVGEQLTEYQALQAMLLPSANNIADSLAAWAFGSLSAYQTAAMHYVQSLGLTGTTIGSDASGFAPDTTSTAHDLVIIAEQALANPVIAQIVAQKSATMPVAGTVQNVNKLLGVDGIIGLKTGNNDQDKGVFVFAATDQISGQNLTLFGVIMGQSSLATALSAGQALLNSAKANLNLRTPVTARQTVATYTTAWGAKATAVTKNALSLVLWNGTAVAPSVTMQTTNLPHTAGATVGHVTFANGFTTVKTDVVLAQPLPAPSFWWRLLRH